MKLKKRLAALVSVIMLMMSINIPLAHAEFFDISENHQLYPIIENLEKRNIITPRPKERFRPDESITRLEFSEMLMRSIGVSPHGFSEIPDSLSIADFDRNRGNAIYLYKMVQLGLVSLNPDNNKVFPDANVKRLEALEMLFKAEGVHAPIYINPKDWKVTDIRHDAWMAPIVAKALQLELVSLDENGFFKGFKSLTRAEAAEMIYKIQLDRKVFNSNLDQKPKVETKTETVVKINQNIITTDEIPKIDMLVDVYKGLLKNFLYQDQIDKDQLMYDAINGMLDSIVDPYTNFAPGNAQSNNISQVLNGKISGIGVEITVKDGRVTVVSPYRNSPGERAGLKANDQILKIDGKDATNISAAQAAMLIRGEKGSFVELYIRRPVEEREFLVNIQRDEIEIESVKVSYEDNIATVSISLFRSGTANEFSSIANEIANKSPKGIILDLRNNPGGFLDSGIQVASHFIPEGKVVTSIEDVNGAQTGFFSRGDGRLAAFPVVILINEGTASASEIVAEALKDYKISTTVGTKSTGKGSVQSLVLYNDNSEFKLTVARWLTPLGRSIDQKGIEPDVKVVPKEADVLAGIDKQMEKAKEIILAQ